MLLTVLAASDPSFSLLQPTVGSISAELQAALPPELANIVRLYAASRVEVLLRLANHCEEGHLAAVRRLDVIYTLTRADGLILQKTVFDAACGRGHLEIAKWYIGRFDVAPTAITEGRGLLAYACGCAQLEVARWLTERFALTVENAKTKSNAALASAIARDHVEAVRWLVDRFGLTAADAQEAFRAHHIGCSPRMVRWLTKRFGFDVRYAK